MFVLPCIVYESHQHVGITPNYGETSLGKESHIHIVYSHVNTLINDQYPGVVKFRIHDSFSLCIHVQKLQLGTPTVMGSRSSSKPWTVVVPVDWMPLWRLLRRRERPMPNSSKRSGKVRHCSMFERLKSTLTTVWHTTSRNRHYYF